MKSIVRGLKRARAYRNEGGFTLVEMLITIVILGMITASITAAFSLSVKTTATANDRIKKSNDAQVITKYLVPDAASAGGFSSSNEDATDGGSSPGVYVQTTNVSDFCGTNNSIVRFEWVARTSGVVTRTASNYSLIGSNLTRLHCTQVIPSTGTPPARVDTTLVVGKNIASASAACFPVSPCGPGKVTPQPTIVSLNVTTTPGPTTPGYSFSASGFVRVGGTEGTATTATVPLIALGVPGTPCPTNQGGGVPTSSGVSVAQRGGSDPFEPKITVYGIAAINSSATTSSPCGQAGNIAQPTGWFAAQTLVGAGGTCNNCGTTIPIAAPLPDPYAGMTPPSSAGCASGPNQPVSTVVGNERRYQPGTYRTQLNLVINNGVDQYIFAPGVYVFCAGVRITSGILAQSTGTEGVLFYFAPNGNSSLRRITTGGSDDFSDINFQIDGRAEYRDVVIWQPNPTTSSASTTGDLEIAIGENDPLSHPLSARYGGVIYAPQAQVEFYLPTRETLGQYETVEATAAGVVARKIVVDRISRIRLGDGPQTTTTLTTSNPNPVVGQAVTLTATVSPVFPATGVPAGVVTFLDDNDQLGTTALVNGVATLTTSALGGGSRPLKAIYSGDLVFASSVSPTINTVFNRAPTTTVLVSGPNPAAIGQPITLTATVSRTGGGPVPTGTVTFYDGVNAIGAGTVDVAGEAEYITPLSEGVHTLRAVYSGDSSYLTSTSGTVDQIVKQGSTVAVFSTPNPSTAGQSVQLRAEVRPVNPGPVATGTVTFFDTGNVQIGAGNIPLDLNGDAILNVTNLAGGAHNITASYSGDALLAPSTSPVHPHTVNFLAGTLTLVSNVNPSVFNTSVTFTATFTGSGPAITGNVEFRSDGVLIGTSAINASGVATLSYSGLALGSHAITARYLGNPNYGQANSPALTQLVQSGTITTITSNRLPSADWGQAITFTATVTESPSGGTNPIGNVNFYDDGALIGQVALTGTTAQLTTTATFFGVGTHHITASFVPTAGDFTASTSTVLNQIVNLATTTLALSSTPNPVSPSQTVTFTATVSAAGGVTPNGTVAFFDAGAFIGQSLLVNGVVTFTHAFGTVGPHPIQAIYPSSGNFRSSTNTITQTVLLIPTTTVLSSSSNPAVPGQTLTLRADITSSMPNPTGSVFFYDGTTFLGSGNVGDNYAVLVVSGGFSGGTHMLTAQYFATGNFQGGTSQVLNLVVGNQGTTTAITTSLTPAPFGSSVTFTATVTAGGFSPTGNVTFFVDGANMGPSPVSGGTATLTLNNLTVGSHGVFGIFVGTGGFTNSTSPTITQVIRHSTAVTLAQTAGNSPSTTGQSVSFTATVTDSSATLTPTGTVSFYDGANPTPLATINLTGTTAVYTTTGLPIGAHSLTAVYNGDATFTASQPSNTVAHTVSAIAVATNIQASIGGAVPNQLSPNDTVTFTFSEAMSPASLMAGFTGASQGVTVRFVRAGSSTPTTLTVCVTADCTTVVNLGTVNLGDQGGVRYLANNSIVFATATMAMTTGAGGSVVTVAFGSTFTVAAGLGLQVNDAVRTMIWTPTALATDANGVPMAVTPVTEQGSADFDF